MNALLAIYPTARKVEDVLKRESARHGCLLGHRTTTFPQLFDELWRELKTPLLGLGPGAERLALEEALRRAQDGVTGVLPLIHGAREVVLTTGRGIGDHLHRFIRELKSAAVTADDLIHACASLPDAIVRPVASLALIFAQYDIILKEAGAVDAHDRERMVVEALHRMERSGERPRLLRPVESLLLAEVYDPSLLQFMLVASLVRMIGDAELTIQAETHKLGINRFTDLTWNRFVAEESIGDKVLPHFVRRGGREGRLGFVLTKLFEETSVSGETAAELPPDDGSVQIVEAPDVSREAEEVARTIRRILERPAAEQIPLRRIAVVARDLSPYADHLETAFRRHRLPLDLAVRKPLSSFPAARVVRMLLQTPALGYRREDLLSLCQAPFIRFAASRYRELLLRAGYIDRPTRPLSDCLASLRSELKTALEHSAQSEVDFVRSRLAQLDRGEQAWIEFLRLLESLTAPSTISAQVAKTLAVLDQFGFDPERESATGQAAASVGAMISALEALSRDAAIVAPRRELTLSEFAVAVDGLVAKTTIKNPREPGGVRAMTVTEARGLDFDLVFILGLNDGVFPAYHNDDPLLPDVVIRRLNRPLRDALRRRLGPFAPDAPGLILRTRYDRNAEEPLLFFLALSMPSRAVVVSYSASDSKGNPLPVSPFVAELNRILKGEALERLPPESTTPAENCFAPDDFLKRAASDSTLNPAAAVRLAEPAQIESILRRTEVEHRRERYFMMPSREELIDGRRKRIKEAGSSGSRLLAADLSPDGDKFACASSYDGHLSPSLHLRRFLAEAPDGGPRRWSAAQLTELAACGFKYFARRLLLLQDADESDHELSPLETGSIVHDILSTVFQRAGRSGTGLQAVKNEVLKESHQRCRLAARDPAFFELDWKSIATMVDEIVDYELARQARGEWPSEMYHEQKFEFAARGISDASTAESFELALVGQIDRIEIYREHGRIVRIKLVDYKTARRLKRYADLLKPDRFGCEDMQMPLYALAAAERFRPELSDDAALEVSYLGLKTRIKESEPQTIPLAALVTPSHETGRGTVAGRVFDLVNSAIAGRFDVDPLQCSDYCPYRNICRFHK